VIENVVIAWHYADMFVTESLAKNLAGDKRGDTFSDFLGDLSRFVSFVTKSLEK